MSDPLFDLFIADVRGLHADLQAACDQLVTHPDDVEQLTIVAETTQAIRGAANLVGLTALAGLLKQLESKAREACEEEQVQEQTFYDALKVVCDLLAELGDVEEGQIQAWKDKTQQVVDQLSEAVETSDIPLLALPEPSVPEGAPISVDDILALLPSSSEQTSSSEPKPEFQLDLTMMDLFRSEAETHLAALNRGLLAVEEGVASEREYEELMRAAHSLKGAARVVGLDPLEELAHDLEDVFQAVQKGRLTLVGDQVDLLLACVDLLAQIDDVRNDQLEEWLAALVPQVKNYREQLHKLQAGEGVAVPQSRVQKTPVEGATDLDLKPPERKTRKITAKDRVLRVNASNLDKLMGLAGESLVESRWLQPFAESLGIMKRSLNDVAQSLDNLREALHGVELPQQAVEHLHALQQEANNSRQLLAQRSTDLDAFIRRHASLSDRLYYEVIDTRMRPFEDAVSSFPRFVRDLGRRLEKQVQLELTGTSTPVDRDILEKLEAPLNHLIRNSVDHGIESPMVRHQAGKPEKGTIRIDARHRAGMLAITIEDDGGGIDAEKLRQKVVEKKLATEEMASQMDEGELIEFLFLPGFSTAGTVTEISGRGVGLDVVQQMIQEVGGTIRTTSKLGVGTTFHLQLPLTLSVIRSLIVQISDEPYAFPLGRVERALMVDPADVTTAEDKQFVQHDNVNIGLIPAAQVLELPERPVPAGGLPTIVLSDRHNSYGIVVDRFLGERDLVVQELDPQLGRIPDIACGAIMEDGAPVLVVDTDDLVRSVDNLLKKGRLHKVGVGRANGKRSVKRVLVVDDSVTVREVESRLLRNQGYEVETAVDGMDGWNALRMGEYDLVITDVDMPRMTGIELVELIRNDPKFRELPIVIISYKERDEERQAGLNAGANEYLTKGSFHDETMLDTVRGLIGGPEIDQ